jgi:4-amino-4-deoxy-L-arabinose transferase-like glycosyltransferase
MTWAPRSSLLGALLVGLAAGAVNAAVAIPFIGRYGWHGDELYFLAAAKHPALGYVDFPPLTAWVGWLIHALFGASLIAFRSFGILLAFAVGILVALIARELGGSRSAQAGAALITVTSPLVLGAGSIYHTTYFDLVATVALLYVAMLAIGRPSPRLWPIVGPVAGIGLEAKYTILAVLLAILAGLVVPPARRLLTTRGPWLAAGIAFLILAPNLVWQIRHGWPSARFFGSQHQATVADTPHLTYLGLGAVLLGAGSVLALVGLVWLWRQGTWLRVFAVIPVVVTVLFFFEGGRSYYPLPSDYVLVAAGAVALTRWIAGGSLRRLAPAGALLCLHGAVLALALPLVVPVRSLAGASSEPLHDQTFFADEVGWKKLVDATAAAWWSMKPSERAGTVILTASYGEAGALLLLGPSRGLQQPLSGHLSWQYWRPKRLPERHVLLVGYPSWSYQSLCSSAQMLELVASRDTFRNRLVWWPITYCELRRPLEDIWNDGIVNDQL